jgi:membrane fusion protein (multidrug efflux system)
MKNHTRYFYIVAAMALGLMAMASCGKKEAPKASHPIPVTVVSVMQKDVTIYTDFIGQTFGIYDIPIRSRVQGFLEGIHFQEGELVKKGQLLYTVDAQPYKARQAAGLSEVAQAKTALVKAENDLNRYKPLAQANAVSQSDLDNAVAHYDAARAQVAAANANLKLAEIELGYTLIYSPIDGIIGKTQAKVGEFVGQNPNPIILNTVSDVSSFNVEFFLTESQYLYMARELQLAAKNDNKPDESRALKLILADGTEFEYPGKVVFMDREVNPTTGTLLVQARFPNPEGLVRPGQFAKVHARSRIIDDALMVPQASVTEIQGQFSIFIVNDSSQAQKVVVEVGNRIDDLWIINKGLKNLDKVILDGIQKVRNGVTVLATEVSADHKTSQQ